MLISCPQCPKVYRLNDGAIPSAGRSLRCAACEYVWFEPGDGGSETVQHEPDHTIDASASLRVLASLLSEKTDAVAAVDAPDYADCVEDTEAVEIDEDFFGDARGQSIGGPLVIDISAPVCTSRAITMAPPPKGRSLPPRSLYQMPDDDDDESVETLNSDHPAFNPIGEFVESWRHWRDTKKKRAYVPPGNEAASNFRNRARDHERNRLTPWRAAGWTVWATAVCGLVYVATTKQNAVETFFPPSAKLYEKAAAFHRPGLAVQDVTTRFAESIDGPVLELRGTVTNDGNDQEMPHLTLIPYPATNDQLIPVNIGQAPLLKGGARPFIVRAQLPAGTTRAALAVVQPQTTQTAGFVLQPNGRGWGQKLPDTLRIRAESN